MTLDLSPFDRTEGMSMMKTETKYDFKNQPEAIRKLFVEYDVPAYLDEYEFRGDSDDYTPNEHEFILLEDAIRGILHDLHTKTLEALSTAPASPPSSVGEEALAHAFRNVDGKDWDYLFANLLNDSGHGKFWKAVMHEVRSLLQEDAKR